MQAAGRVWQGRGMAFGNGRERGAAGQRGGILDRGILLVPLVPLNPGESRMNFMVRRVPLPAWGVLSALPRALASSCPDLFGASILSGSAGGWADRWMAGTSPAMTRWGYHVSSGTPRKAHQLMLSRPTPLTMVRCRPRGGCGRVGAWRLGTVVSGARRGREAGFWTVESCLSLLSRLIPANLA